MTSAACVAQRGAAWRGVAQRGAACAVQRGAWCKMDDKHARQRIQLEKMGGRPASFCEQRPPGGPGPTMVRPHGWCVAQRGAAWRVVRGAQRGARCKMDDKHARQRIQLEKMGGRPAFFCEQRPQAALAQLWLEHTGGAWRSVARRGAWCAVQRDARCNARR